MKMTDQRIEGMVSLLLKAGVLVAGSTVLAGGIYYLVRHGAEPVHYSTFHGEPEINRSVSKILAGVRNGRSQAIIQLGILLLIATPIARVALSLVGFAIERDRTYVILTALVLCILLFSLTHNLAG